MMSSATSIDKVRLDPDSASSLDVRPAGGGPDAGLKPWHFFVLVSLAASTVAVLMSRQSSPEHLILLSFTIGAAGVAAAAFYRMLAPLAVPDELLLSERPSERVLAALEREKALVLRSIKELVFDRAMGKVSPKDFDEMAGRLRARALMLMKQIDAGGSGYREMIERELQARLKKSPGTARASASAAQARSQHPAARACLSCGTTNDPDAAFCKRCGKALVAVNQ
jgi:ribosomal protein L40E